MRRKNETEGLCEYRVRLCREDVLLLRERAARVARLTGQATTWQTLLRAAVSAAATEGAK